MKYKIKDRVKIKSWANMEQEFGLDNYGNIKMVPVFMKGMRKHCEKVVTIKSVHLNSYDIKEDGWSWTDEMIHHVIIEKI